LPEENRYFNEETVHPSYYSSPCHLKISMQDFHSASDRKRVSHLSKVCLVSETKLEARNRSKIGRASAKLRVLPKKSTLQSVYTRHQRGSTSLPPSPIPKRASDHLSLSLSLSLSIRRVCLKVRFFALAWSTVPQGT